jgi:hypothetical protein
MKWTTSKCKMEAEYEVADSKMFKVEVEYEVANFNNVSV